jgi:hypothetical protein
MQLTALVNQIFDGLLQTSDVFTAVLKWGTVTTSMNGRGRPFDIHCAGRAFKVCPLFYNLNFIGIDLGQA